MGEGSRTPENSLARQPIFDSQRLVYGYELLFRPGPENCCGQARDVYFLALDDFEDGPQWRDLLLLADFIKVDVLATPPAEQHSARPTFSGAATSGGLRKKWRPTRTSSGGGAWEYQLVQAYFFSRREMRRRAAKFPRAPSRSCS
jgi:c-di-GMP-related signal transduction protein